ncbi:NAD-dependent protein deacetylase, SIR2 family [Frateuria aurantia DSM 6220]|uniref:protein acetyllysine N-acetyltransferase n=1 Tax=Frateuria aurantia (strain ATCC 33424 / DSM 6220 / KCTC 2777 / LMG 1558 / NBRC 3245 / NCIMB 13370) TaxID=767434 RepID=H8L4L2_FRAAD|nr:NAD-dependent protein deacetylase, SIR2 family [Frateuria aurantia DSM 6220]
MVEAGSDVAASAAGQESLKASWQSLWRRHRRWWVLSGAGCSTEAGIPCYRDQQGAWQHPPPVTWQDFTRSPTVRQRYWIRSRLGWPRFAAAQPTAMHHALARAGRAGRLSLLVTQNVDGLHQRAGSPQVLDLHGRLDRVRCLGCGAISGREALQSRLEQAGHIADTDSLRRAPDGDMDWQSVGPMDFRVPDCEHCGGILKPDVVFFGEALPAERPAQALASLTEADAVLVIGSSLMVYSGYRLVREAARLGLPVVAINQGRTRADDLFSLKIERPCGEVAAWLD